MMEIAKQCNRNRDCKTVKLTKKLLVLLESA